VNPDVSQFLYGAIGGGAVAAAWKMLDTYVVQPRFISSAEAKRKVILYGRPLYLNCYQLEYRLNHILKKLEAKNYDEVVPLKRSPSEARSLEWFTKDGYYATSSAYVIACLAAWISLFQADVVFLPFRKRSIAAQFFDLIERFKISVSTNTILWYHYLDGIGEMLVDEKHDRPMTFSSFSHKLLDDASFRDYYDQLFQFLQQVASDSCSNQIRSATSALRDIKTFLAENNVVPGIESYERAPSDRERPVIATTHAA
jgi:hypothetical protein